MDNRATLHYAADVRETVGQLVGPNGFGEMLVVDEVEWDGQRSTVRLRNATVDEAPTPARPASLTKPQVRELFWLRKSERDAMNRQIAVQAVRVAKAEKRTVRSERGGLSKRQYDRIRKAANL